MRRYIVQLLHAMSLRVRTQQGGFSIIEVVVSAALLGVTATGTYFALDTATATSYENARASIGYQVAASEIERLRRMGDTNITTLLAQDNQVRHTTIKGIVYRINIRAFYKDGIGSSFTDACGNAGGGSSNNSGAKYIYLSVQVSQPAGNTTVTGAAGSATQLAFLDTYFATEGGDLQTASGTLRVYVKGAPPTQTPETGTTVQLYKNNVLTASAVTNNNGCVLFVGMARGDYEVRIPTTTKIDLYGTTNPIKLTVKMPSRGALTRTINMSLPVTLNINWYTRLTAGNTTKTYVTPGAAGIPNLVGPFVVMNPGLVNTIPSGLFFKNNQANIQLYPVDPVEGYSLYPGSCTENDPDDGNAGNGDERVKIPATGSSGWSGGGTYSPNPELLVPQFRIRVGQANLSSWASGARVQVKMTGNTCGAFPSGGATNWTRLNGTTDSNGYLANTAYVLPKGTYEVCVRHTRGPFYYGWDWFHLNPYWVDYYGYANNVANAVPGPNNYSYATASTSACGNGSLWG